MSILKTYVKGDMKKNRKSYDAARMTIFLAVLILSTFVFGVFSYFKSYLNMPNDMGNAHFAVSAISSEEANNLLSNRHIKKVGFSNTKVLEEGFGSREKARFYKIDDNALSTMKSSLKEGTLPEEKQVLISSNMAREIGKNPGDTIEIEGNGYNISGIYYDTAHAYQNFYNIYANVSQDQLLQSKETLAPFIWYKNIFSTYSLSKEILDTLETKNIAYKYNHFYLNRSFVFDPEEDLLKKYFSHLLVVVFFIILIILFYSIVVNVFLVQEPRSILEYSKLKSIGATNKDISKIIRFKGIYLSQLPILSGIIFSLGLIKAVFLLISGVEKYIFNGKDLYLIYRYLDLRFDFRLVLFVYLLSLLIIYLSMNKPIRTLKKHSILDGLKGKITGKNHKKHDLKYTGDIGKDLSKQFYNNSKSSFRLTGFTLKIGFLLMVFIMMAITCYSMDKKYNRVSSYETYDIQVEYTTFDPLNEDFIKGIKTLKLMDFVNFRKESVSLDVDDSQISDEYKGSLSHLEEEISSLKNMQAEIFGIEDEKFKELVSSRGLNPDDYGGDKVILLNAMGNDFNIPVANMVDRKFLKDDIKELSLAEDSNLVDIAGTRGYEFTLNVEDKIDTPLFDYPVKKNRLNIYMPKSQYIKLFNNFLRIGDLDQYEYLSIKTNDEIEEIQESINQISLEYFNGKDYWLESRLDEELLVKKRNIIGSILAIFLSIFFVVIGFSNCYFSFYNLFFKRKGELSLYKAIGMDEDLLENILQKERRKILFGFIFSIPFIILAVLFIVAKLFRLFTPIDILLNLNYLFVIVLISYIFIIYVAISKMYNKFKKEIVGR